MLDRKKYEDIIDENMKRFPTRFMFCESIKENRLYQENLKDKVLKIRKEINDKIEKPERKDSAISKTWKKWKDICINRIR